MSCACVGVDEFCVLSELSMTARLRFIPEVVVPRLATSNEQHKSIGSFQIFNNKIERKQICSEELSAIKAKTK